NSTPLKIWDNRCGEWAPIIRPPGSRYPGIHSWKDFIKLVFMDDILLLENTIILPSPFLPNRTPCVAVGVHTDAWPAVGECGEQMIVQMK
ncbi:hypothetical protein HAX54_003921, partial [Datura stramonium]|nr:hypothetical protein [Datura stramonium]